jgi:hypothetical protein
VSVEILTIIVGFYSILGKLLPDRLVKGLLFKGELQETHKTEFAVTTFVDRYKNSISALNRAFTLNVAFVVLAVYPLFGLTEGSSIDIPFLNLSISTKQWIMACPLISYALQLYALANLFWFMLLRRGLTLLKDELKQETYFGEVSNVLLTGLIGIIWLFLSIYSYFRSKLQYIWYVPFVVLVIVLLTSPTLLCGYLVIRLYSTYVPLALVYSMLFVPSVGLSFILVALGSILGLSQHTLAFLEHKTST